MRQSKWCRPSQKGLVYGTEMKWLLDGPLLVCRLTRSAKLRREFDYHFIERSMVQRGDTRLLLNVDLSNGIVSWRVEGEEASSTGTGESSRHVASSTARHKLMKNAEGGLRHVFDTATLEECHAPSVSALPHHQT